MKISIDIETSCNLGCKVKCEHALYPHTSKITVIGTYTPEEKKVFRSLKQFKEYIDSIDSPEIIGHNFKFDIKHLAHNDIDLIPYWKHDTYIMAVSSYKKIPEKYLEAYDMLRVEENKKLKKGYSHRKASKHSLKTLAPYFLRVKPFWENPEDHNNDTYVLKDVEYTYKLFEHFEAALQNQGTIDFYNNYMMPWSKLLLGMELRGITIDMPLMDQLEDEYKKKCDEYLRTLDIMWREAHNFYHNKKYNELKKKYDDMATKALEKAKDKERTKLRYQGLFNKAKESLETKINLNSPAQLNWLLKDYFSLDITNFQGDETTGKSVLEKLASEGHKDLEVFLNYRKANKLVTSFFPTYRSLNVNEKLHASFNLGGTRTGRLSSSDPNLQQVAGDLHRLFIARPGYKLATFDASAIEPRLIAYYSEDPILIDIINSDADFHGHNTKIFFNLECRTFEVKEKYPNERKVGKEDGLLLFYGGGYRRIKESTMKYGFKWSDAHCKHIYHRFHEEYEGVFNFKAELDKRLKEGPVFNLLGRPIFIKEPQDIHLQGFNTLIQSSASDLILESARRIQARFIEEGIDGNVLLLIHDEIVTEIPEDKQDRCKDIIVEAMTSYDLPTEQGNIELKVEGKISDRWEK